MGESTFVNQVNARPKATSQVKSGTDWILISVVAGLSLFGLLMVYSAGPKFALANGSPADFFVRRQVIWAVVGLVLAVVLSRINYHYYQRLAVLMIVFTIIALILSAALGNTTLGANRSLLNGSIRPSELAKVVTIIYVAVWLTAKRDVLNDITVGLLPLMVILGL
ncbi:MAG TPA: FtsW/RodA/SpoVE family cell cycle protein, partial [Anaerolineaceae bacterium]